jgi:glycosyltransferase involved in cell wall biosynthesis
VVPIATNVGGLPEVVEHGKTGFLSKVGDVEGMARCAIDLLSDDAKLTKMAKAGRIAAQGHFCSTRIIPQYEKFYRGVLERASE